MIELLLTTSKATTIPIMANAKVGRAACKQFHAGLVPLVAENPEIALSLLVCGSVLARDFTIAICRPRRHQITPLFELDRAGRPSPAMPGGGMGGGMGDMGF